MKNYRTSSTILGVALFIFTGQVFGARMTNKPESQSKITGIAIDSKGEPVADALVTFYPLIADRVKTDAKGTFSVTKKTGINLPFYEAIPYIMVRHIERNLVMVDQLSDNTENLHIELLTGIILSGKVVDPNGKEIKNANLSFGLKPYYSELLYGEPYVTDEQGNFEIKAAPPDFNCVYFAQADGFGHVF